VLVLMRLNRQYRAEASALEISLSDRHDLVKHTRHRVLVLVDSVDLAVLEAMRYAKGLHADELTAVHFVLDEARAARLQVRWQHFGYDSELRVLDCADRHLSHAAERLVAQIHHEYPDATVTVLLPRRMYSQLGGRLLHDRTADNIARVISRIPGASAQIVAYDVGSRVAEALRNSEGDGPDRATEPTGKSQATTPVF